MPRNKSITDDDLLASCRDTFLAAGVGVSTMRLARDAGVSQGVLFQRFGTKDDLFFAAMRLPAPDFEASIAEAERASTIDGVVELGRAASRYLNAQMPIILLVLSHPIYRSSQPGSRELLADAQVIGRHLREYIVARHAHGNPATASELLVSTLLTDAFHRAIGVGVERDETEWLRSLVDTLGIA